ncbi:MAG: GNAT family N-acetyltransferase [Actinomycetes bacterium]
MTPIPPDGRSLVGRHVRLDATAPQDAAGLFAALDDARVWDQGYGGGPAGRPADTAGMQALVDAAMEASLLGDRQAYVVRLRADDLGPAETVVGTTGLGVWDLTDERLHLGWTAYGPRWWGTAVNAECKLLVLRHAFEDCGFGRVKIQTDLRNTRSHAAIARLGAAREGVLRRHMRRADGTFRDTVVFSIIRDEWPAVRDTLLARLGG